MDNNSSDESTPQPLFQFSENFSTAYFGKLPETELGEERTTNDRKLISNFIALLIDPANRELKHDVLSILRNSKSQQFLIDLIGMKEYHKNHKELIMACWESGMDFSMHLDVFVNLIQDPLTSPEVLLEVITVIEEMAGPFDTEVAKKADTALNSFPEKHAFYPLVAALHRKFAA